MNLLETITQLSHEFGTPEYVKGGGGNTSVKDAETLWVKPSGTTLGGMTPATFVAMDRSKIGNLYATAAPVDVNERERWVVGMMADCVRPDSSGRPSVEAPLHDTFQEIFVVHTHSELVNGMTCAREGAAACARLFPEALWIEYIDPGYTLCTVVRERMKQYREQHGSDPRVVILDNHGIFVSGNTPEEIRAAYAKVTGRLKEEYAKSGIATTLATGPAPAGAAVGALHARLKDALGADAACIAAGGKFTVARGPISPDHIVYAKSYPFLDEPTPEALAAFRARHGYAPRVVETADAVYGVGANQKQADLALHLAQDGALLTHLAEAFGGIEYLDDAQRGFIENWEAEAYRQQQVAK